jgi:hypothetical protein
MGLKYSRAKVLSVSELRPFSGEAPETRCREVAARCPNASLEKHARKGRSTTRQQPGTPL